MKTFKASCVMCVLVVAPLSTASAASCFHAGNWRNIANAYAIVRARTDEDPRISRQSWQGRAWNQREKGRAVPLSKAYQSLSNKFSVGGGTVVNIEFAEISGKRDVTCKVTLVQTKARRYSKTKAKAIVCSAPDLLTCKRQYKNNKRIFQFDFTVNTSLVKTGAN